MRPGEVWLPVVGFEGSYETSNLGRVRSVRRIVSHSWSGSKTVPSRILSQRLGNKGRRVQKLYPTVQLRDANHKKYSRKVHVLVLEAFIGPRPEGYEGCHNNDDPMDNRLENLRWDTRSANMRDAVVNGGHPQSRKTMCRHGHEYAAGNLYIRPDGGRGCRACRRKATEKHRVGKAA